MGENKPIRERIAFNVLGIAVFIGLWQMLVYGKQDPALISIDRIARSFTEIITSKEFLISLASTMKIVTIGIAISVVAGICVAVAMDLNSTIRNMLSPVIEILRNIPSITLFPILLVVYGVGDTARIFIIFWTSFPSILLSTTYGLSKVDEHIIGASQIDGADKMQIMSRIKLPLAMPNALNGVKIGIGNGFVAIVVAEMLGATKGIGYMVLWTTNAFKYSETCAYIIIIGLLGMGMNAIMQLFINKYEREIGL